MSARKANPAAKRASAPDINAAIRELQKLEATAQCVAFAMTEDMDGVDFSDAVVMIAERLSTALLTLDAVEVNIGREVSDGRK